MDNIIKRQHPAYEPDYVGLEFSFARSADGRAHQTRVFITSKWPALVETLTDAFKRVGGRGPMYLEHSQEHNGQKFYYQHVSFVGDFRETINRLGRTRTITADEKAIVLNQLRDYHLSCDL